MRDRLRRDIPKQALTALRMQVVSHAISADHQQ